MLSTAVKSSAWLRELVEARLGVELDGKFLSLAQPRFADSG